MNPTDLITKKCDFNEPDYGTATVTEKNFIVNEIDLREKRSVQKKCVEYMTLRLFQKNIIFSLINILLLP